MIIECEKCHTKFRLDENLLKETGSKVRCSICDYKFILFPPHAEQKIKEAPPTLLEEEEKTPLGEVAKEEELASVFDKTLVADVLEEPESMPSEKIPKEEEVVSDFDQTFGEEIEQEMLQEEEMEPVSFEDISQLDSGVIRGVDKKSPAIEKAMDRAAKVEEKIIAKEERERAKEVKKGEAPAKPQPIMKKKRRVGLTIIILVIILLLVGAASAIILFRPDLLPESIPFFKKPLSKEQAFDTGNKRLSFRELKGTFVDSKKAGKLFVVSGTVINDYPDKRNFIRIKSNILDSKGMVIQSKIVYAGNPVSTTELQTLSVEEINNMLVNKLGKNNINVNINPTSSIPFMIVFDNLPEDVSEFTVEAISSLPAK
jgi:predicted Zn finger-like uncharacterized protein